MKLGDSPLLKKSGLKESHSSYKPSMIGSLPPQIKSGGGKGIQKPLSKGNFNWEDTANE
jgi:hypothetical protein